ncbi:MAG: MoaD/ThiS family protein [Gammaproteobacteria bacterium TMED92]|nr:MAG: MoaD/ThiS family protein [Gammaproteobacteria bacterium TMED92]
MATITLPDECAAITGGECVLSIAVDNYRDLHAELVLRWPKLDALLNRYAVAIDGQIYQDAFMEPLAAHSDVFFMPRIEGG